MKKSIIIAGLMATFTCGSLLAATGANGDFLSLKVDNDTGREVTLSPNQKVFVPISGNGDRQLLYRNMRSLSKVITIYNDQGTRVCTITSRGINLVIKNLGLNTIGGCSFSKGTLTTGTVVQPGSKDMPTVFIKKPGKFVGQ